MELSDKELSRLEAQVNAAKRALASQQASKNLIDFVRFMQPDTEFPDDCDYSRYRVAQHHRVIAEALETVASGKCLRMILSIPPQHGKQCAHETTQPASIGPRLAR